MSYDPLYRWCLDPWYEWEKRYRNKLFQKDISLLESAMTECTIDNRCHSCAYLVDDGERVICDDCGKRIIDIPDEECSMNMKW